MSDLWTDAGFWLAVAFASLVKVNSPPPLPWGKRILSLLTGALGATVFTQPVLAYLEWDGAIYMTAVAALLALTADHFARQLLALKLKDILRTWRGGGEGK